MKSDWSIANGLMPQRMKVKAGVKLKKFICQITRSGMPWEEPPYGNDQKY